MSKIWTTTVHNWQEFTDIIDKTKVHENNWVWFFRGQADKEWALVPTLNRELAQCGVTDKEQARICERETLWLFQTQAHLYEKSNMPISNTWTDENWLSLMQHYSCPTRLLDWTASPYVAVYFAVNHLPNRDGAIWFFNGDLLQLLMDRKYGPLLKEKDALDSDKNYVAVLVCDIQSERSAAQQGYFTICTNIIGNHGEIIAEELATGGSDNRIHQVVIPKDLKNDFLSRLHTMNITASSLFPGIDGLGRVASEIVRLHPLRYPCIKK